MIARPPPSVHADGKGWLLRTRESRIRLSPRHYGMRKVAVRAVSEVFIARPPEEVAAFAIDPRNDKTWIGGLVRVELPAELPLRAGSRVARVSRFLGRDIVYVLEVEALEPGRRLLMGSIAGPFPMRVTYEFDAAPQDGTRMRIINEGDAAGVFSLAAPLLSRMVKSRVDADLQRLKAAVERQASP